MFPKIVGSFLLIGLLAIVDAARCPSSPNSMCDFYIEKWKFALPTFRLKRYRNDTVISGRIYSRKNNKPAFVTSDGYCYFLPKARTTCGQQFYFRGLRQMYNANRIASRTFTRGSLRKFRNKCVRMNITNARIIVGKKRGKYIYEVINEKDGNNKYRPSRRCIVFKTDIIE